MPRVQLFQFTFSSKTNRAAFNRTYYYCLQIIKECLYSRDHKINYRLQAILDAYNLVIRPTFLIHIFIFNISSSFLLFDDRILKFSKENVFQRLNGLRKYPNKLCNNLSKCVLLKKHVVYVDTSILFFQRPCAAVVLVPIAPEIYPASFPNMLIQIISFA